MGIGKYIKEIGRGNHGARALTREQAADLFGQMLDGAVTDLEIGAFCVAMRIKGETAQEMAGFLDATHPACTGCPAPNAHRRHPQLQRRAQVARAHALAGAAAGAPGFAGRGAWHGHRVDPGLYIRSAASP